MASEKNSSSLSLYKMPQGVVTRSRDADNGSGKTVSVNAKKFMDELISSKGRKADPPAVMGLS